MEAMANFFESINRLLGVSGPGELVMHPVFLGVCLAAFIYALVRAHEVFCFDSCWFNGWGRNISLSLSRTVFQPWGSSVIYCCNGRVGPSVGLFGIYSGLRIAPVSRQQLQNTSETTARSIASLSSPLI